MKRYTADTEEAPEAGPSLANVRQISDFWDANVKPNLFGMSFINIVPGRCAKPLHAGGDDERK
jgi:hypothetical protein